MDKYKSTEKLLTPIYETCPIFGDEGVDNMNYSMTSETGVDYSLCSRNSGIQEVPNFVLGPYDPRRRPVSMYEPWINLIEPEGYTSLPPDVPDNASCINFDQYPNTNKTYWEAEDADEYIATLDESTILDIESFENIQQGIERQEQQYVTVTADVHHHKSHLQSGACGTDIDIYATIRKNDKKINNNKIDDDATEMKILLRTSSSSTSNTPPNIMTASCYGTLNACPNPQQNQENAQQNISMTNSIIDEYSSMNSSTLFEPNSLISSVEMRSSMTITPEKNRVKWWDESSQEIEIQQIANQDLAAIRKILENETGGALCPSCQMPFDKGKKRKLIDTCGHERCYSCMFRNEACPICRCSNNNSGIQGKTTTTTTTMQDNDIKQQHDYDTGIGSTTTLMSPIGSPQPACRSHVKTNGHFTSYMQSRSELSSPSPELGKLKRRPAKCSKCSTETINGSQCCLAQPSRGLAELTSNSCGTPPSTRRRIFLPKNLRNPFSIKRHIATVHDNSTLSGLPNELNTSTTSNNSVTTNNSSSTELVLNCRRRRKPAADRETNKFNRLSLGAITTPGQLSSFVFGKIKSLWSADETSANVGLNLLADDEGGNVKPVNLQNKSQACQDELQVRLGFFLENNPRRNMRAPVQSCSSLTSANTSPISTLTGSSEADVSRVTQESGQGCDSIGSLMSVSVSEQSNASSSPLSRRHSVTTAQAGQVEELSLFKNRKIPARRSARSGQVKGPVDPRIRFAQFRQPQINLKPIFFEVPSQESDPLFIGRQWLIRELTTTIAAPECTGILINGNLGTGKTALMLQLVDYSCFGRRKDIPDIQENDGIYCQINVAIDRIRLLASQVVAYHFCQAEYNTTCFIPDFIHSVAAQLCQAPAFSAYHDFLLSEAHLQNVLTMKECIADPERAIKQGILEPLAALRRVGKIPAKNFIILIDALCEAEYHKPDQGDTIASFLSKIIEHFPPWLKVIATVRTQMMEFTKCLPFSKISLDAWTSNDCLQKDMLDYISYRVNHSPSIQGNVGSCTKDSSMAQIKFTQHLLSLTKGSFLFAKLTLDLIERRNLVIKSTSYKVLPVSLAQIYLLNFNLRFPSTTAYDKVMPILSVCLAALYPLTLVEIFYSVNALLCELPLEWEEFLDRFKTLTGFLIKRLDNTYMFFHPSFREWLIRRDENESTKFLIDLRTGHAAIAFRLCRLQIPLDPEQTLELGHHILKAHLYRNAPSNQSPRDLQAFWVANATKCASSALCTLRNVYNPNVKVSRLLLLAGASPDHITPFLGNAPVLCIAAHEGVVPMVSLLLEYEADVFKTNSQGCTPLIFAASKGHTDVVRQLVAAGSAVGQVDITQRSALVHAATFGHLKVVKYLIACDWNTREDSNDISLQEAAQQACIVAAGQGYTEIVEEFLDMPEVDVDAVGTVSGETALTSAAMNGHTDTLAVLLSRGANCDIRNRKELSPLLLAVKEGHWGIVERLLQNLSDVEQTDMNGKTALMIAAEEGHVGIIELLLSRGANLDKTDNDGLTALCWACLRGKLQAAKRLLEEKADKQHADNTGRTPLDLAAYQGSAALVQLLIDNGAQIEHVDINGMRPLDRAIACRNVQVVQVFLKRGAKLGPATWAMASGKPEILLILLNKLLEDGNTLYRKNRLQEASHRYQYALKKIPVPEQQIENAGTFQQLKFNFLLNLSRCKRKMNDATEAIELATMAIELKPHSYDGYYARAKALLEVSNTADAFKDAKSALERSKNQSIEIKDALIRLHEDLNKRNLANSRNAIYTELTDL